MTVYSFSPKHRNQNVVYISFGFLVAALMGVTGAALDRERSAFYWIFVLVSCFLMLFLLTRYHLRAVTYVVAENRFGDLDLAVVETRGRREIVTCRIALSDLRRLLPDTRQTRKVLKKEYRGAKRYDYCVDVGVPDAVFLVAEDGERTVLLRLSPDERLYAILKDAVGE